MTKRATRTKSQGDAHEGKVRTLFQEFPSWDPVDEGSRDQRYVKEGPAAE